MIYDYYLSSIREPVSNKIDSLKQETGNDIREMQKNAWDGYWKDKCSDFLPNPGDIEGMPFYSWFLKIQFTLKKPFSSKDETELHPYDNKNNEIHNPIVHDWIFGCPIIRPTTWKGHLRFAAERVVKDKKILIRLFGNEKGEQRYFQKGRLHFFTSFFDIAPAVDVITPLSRETRTPQRGPISIEMIPACRKGEFNLLYVPYPKGKDFDAGQIKKDFKSVASYLKAMFLAYGFSAKKTSGFGVIEDDIKGSRFYIKGTKKNSDKGNIQKKPDKVTSLKDIGKIISRGDTAISSKIAEFEINTLDELESLLDKLNQEGIW